MPRQSIHPDSYFSDGLFKFLRALKRNNNRVWFEKHRTEYEAHVREPMLRFLADFKPRFEKIAPDFVCDPRPVGGSMFRIHRDMRFLDPGEGPYKTQLSAQFQHHHRLHLGKDVHAPGFYLHLEPGSCFYGGGLWRPPTNIRNKIHLAIAQNPTAWLALKKDRTFASTFTLEGEMLKKPSPVWRETLPAALKDDFRLKDFLFTADLSPDLVTSPVLMNHLLTLTRRATKFMNFLSRAL
jgi:uncharacterized protein (TIGR02453 family)